MNEKILLLFLCICKLLAFSSQQTTCNIEWNFIKNVDESIKEQLKERLNTAFQNQKNDGSKYSFDCRSLRNDSTKIFDLTNGNVSVLVKPSTAVVASFKGAKCGNETQKLQIVVMCGDDTFQLVPIEQQPPCLLTFLLTTKKSFCAPYAATSNHEPAASDNGSKSVSGSHFGGVGAFFLVVFLFICGYFLCGFLYKRYVAGAQGYEQIPHYLFWRRLMRAIQAPLAGSQYHRPSPNDPSYRNYDDGDEFRYDQPPLMPASNTDPSPIGGQNRLVSRSAVNNAKDDSDVRLLVV